METPDRLANGLTAPMPAPTVSDTTIFNARSVVQTLESLMHRVTEQEVSATTVNAACNCAARIVDLLRLHLEAERLQRARKP